MSCVASDAVVNVVLVSAIKLPVSNLDRFEDVRSHRCGRGRMVKSVSRETIWKKMGR